MRFPPLAVLGALFALGACHRPEPPARYAGNVFRRGAERFRLDPPGAPWRRVQAPGGDLAWFDPATDAVIAANATCHGFKDAPLTTLLNDLLIGTTRREVVLDEFTRLDGREAIHDVVRLEIDGVAMVYDLYVLKKDGCVYDLSLLTRPHAYDAVADVFVDVVVTFRGLGGGS